MKRRKLIRGLVLAVLCAALTAGSFHVSFAELTNDLIQESENAKKEAEENKKNLQNGLTNVKKVLQDLNAAKDNLEDYITELDEDLTKIEGNINQLTVELARVQGEINTTQEELEQAKITEENQYETMKKRIKYMYERGNKSYVDLFFTASSFGDFLNTAEYIGKINTYDRAMLDSYIENRRFIEEKEQELQAKEAELKNTQDGLQNEHAAMEELMASKEEEIVAYESDIDNKEAAVKEYEAYIAEQEATIKELERQIAAERKRLEEENASARNYDGGKFAFPAPDYKRISDDYGNRMHPTLGIQKFHNGIDLASSNGSRILAAYDGEVVAAAYSSTMGNYIMINHGDGIYTVYMHASALLVSKGQTVSRGDQIAKVGSTGRSTGPHLHFSVRENGNYVSPWKYLK